VKDRKTIELSYSVNKSTISTPKVVSRTEFHGKRETEMGGVRLFALGVAILLVGCDRDSVSASGVVVKQCSSGLKIVQWRKELYVKTLTSYVKLQNGSVNGACEAVKNIKNVAGGDRG
jgi:hypothetical protein